MQEHSASLDLAASRAAQTSEPPTLPRQGQLHSQGTDMPSEEDAAADGEPAPRPFTVRDRRFWASDAGDAGDDSGRAGKPTYVCELEDKVAQAEAKTAATLAQYQAARADFDAARARLRRDLSREVEAGKRCFLVELLDVVDNLDRAIAAAVPAGGARADAHSLLEGVTMVQRLFIAKLAQLGVQRMSCAGTPFDAQRHEALATTPVREPEQDGLVQGVVREGYLLGDTTLRFAQVAVGRLAPAAPAAPATADGAQL